MASVSTFGVERQTHGLFNFKYIISFETLLGDVPNFVIDTSNLIDNANSWDVTATSEGGFSHIKLEPGQISHEIQSIKLSVLDPTSLVGTTFSLTFGGQHTEPIPWDADENEVRQKLETLSTVGDLIVTLDVDDSSNDRTWQVTFNPYEGKSYNSLANFGNLPPLGTSNVDENIISVTIETVQDGASPFRVDVSPNESVPANTTAYDDQGVRHYEGLSTGVYKSDTHFYISVDGDDV